MATKPLQHFRHEAKDALYASYEHLRGERGLTPDEQVAKLEEALNRANEAVTYLIDALDYARSRDITAYLARKAEEKAAKEAEDDDDNDDDDGEYVLKAEPDELLF